MARELGNLATANLASSTNRREVLKYGIELGAATFAAGVAVTSVAAAGTGGGGAGKVVFQNALHQDHEDPGVDPGVTPVPGVQADGTTLWRVQVAAMDMENKIDAQGFFPGEITINAGDSIWFEGKMPGFHTVTFFGQQEVPPFTVTDPSDGLPSAEAQPPQYLNPDIAFPKGDPLWDGVELLNSGLDVLRAEAGPFVVAFTEPGTYDYVCYPHQSVMKGKVVVQEAGSQLPHDQAGYDALAQEQIAQVLAEGKAAAEQYAEAVPGESGSGVDWVVSAGAGEGQGRVMKFLPENFTIKAGQTVRWINRSIGEPHTVTFLSGGDGQGGDVIPVEQPGGPPKLLLNPAVWGPVGGNVYTGEGYLNSGVFDKTMNTDTFDLKFETPGTFEYICVLHPMMVAQITVEE